MYKVVLHITRSCHSTSTVLNHVVLTVHDTKRTVLAESRQLQVLYKNTYMLQMKIDIEMCFYVCLGAKLKCVRSMAADAMHGLIILPAVHIISLQIGKSAVGLFIACTRIRSLSQDFKPYST